MYLAFADTCSPPSCRPDTRISRSRSSPPRAPWKTWPCCARVMWTSAWRWQMSPNGTGSAARRTRNPSPSPGCTKTTCRSSFGIRPASNRSPTYAAGVSRSARSAPVARPPARSFRRRRAHRRCRDLLAAVAGGAVAAGRRRHRGPGGVGRSTHARRRGPGCRAAAAGLGRRRTGRSDEPDVLVPVCGPAAPPPEAMCHRGSTPSACPTSCCAAKKRQIADELVAALVNVIATESPHLAPPTCAGCSTSTRPR